MKAFFTAFAVLMLNVALVGCTKESSVKKETTVKSPEGKTTTTVETTVQTKGKNPPPANSSEVPNP